MSVTKTQASSMKPLDVVKIVEDLTHQNINIEPMIRNLKVESFYFTLCADITANKAHEASRKGKSYLDTSRADYRK